MSIDNESDIIIGRFKCKETTSFATSYRSYIFEEGELYNIQTVKKKFQPWDEVYLIENKDGEYIDPLSKRFIDHTFTHRTDEVRDDIIDDLLL